jgi:hypothetical protein
MTSGWFRSIGLALCLIAPFAHAIEDRADIDPSDPLRTGQSVAWKATWGHYRNAEHGVATDLNLRGNTEDTTYWLGSYNGADGFSQSRLGIERSTAVEYGRVISSLQIASGGFFGGSLTWMGPRGDAEGFAPLLGWGRTNVKPYVNLNFDPNDSVLWGVAYTHRSLGDMTLFQVVDDRLGTGQRVTHLVWRRPLVNAIRLTADVFARKGASEAGQPVVSGNGFSVTADIQDFFLRLAYDQKVNFSESKETRVSIGVRF